MVIRLSWVSRSVSESCFKVLYAENGTASSSDESIKLINFREIKMIFWRISLKDCKSSRDNLALGIVIVLRSVVPLTITSSKFKSSCGLIVGLEVCSSAFHFSSSLSYLMR